MIAAAYSMTDWGGKQHRMRRELPLAYKDLPISRNLHHFHVDIMPRTIMSMFSRIKSSASFEPEGYHNQFHGVTLPSKMSQQLTKPDKFDKDSPTVPQALRLIVAFRDFRQHLETEYPANAEGKTPFPIPTNKALEAKLEKAESLAVPTVEMQQFTIDAVQEELEAGKQWEKFLSNTMYQKLSDEVRDRMHPHRDWLDEHCSAMDEAYKALKRQCESRKGD